MWLDSTFLADEGIARCALNRSTPLSVGAFEHVKAEATRAARLWLHHTTICIFIGALGPGPAGPRGMGTKEERKCGGYGHEKGSWALLQPAHEEAFNRVLIPFFFTHISCTHPVQFPPARHTTRFTPCPTRKRIGSANRVNKPNTVKPPASAVHRRPMCDGKVVCIPRFLASFGGRATRTSR